MTDEARKVRDELARKYQIEVSLSHLVRTGQRHPHARGDAKFIDIWLTGFNAGYEYERARSEKLIKALNLIGMLAMSEIGNGLEFNRRAQDIVRETLAEYEGKK